MKSGPRTCRATANALQRHGHVPAQVCVKLRHADPMRPTPPCPIVLQCKLCRAVSGAGAACGRCAARPLQPPCMNPCYLCCTALCMQCLTLHVHVAAATHQPVENPLAAPSPASPCAGAAQLRGAALPALPLLRHMCEAALRRQPQLPRLQLRRHRLPNAAHAPVPMMNCQPRRHNRP